jgi:hypothetical protein
MTAQTTLDAWIARDPQAGDLARPTQRIELVPDDAAVNWVKVFCGLVEHD